MNFPRDHFPHNCAVEWWYFWGLFLDRGVERFYHYSLFKSSIGWAQGLRLYSSLDGVFAESDEWRIEKDEYSCGFGSGSFTARCSQFSLSLLPLINPVIQDDKEEEVYYYIPHLKGIIKLEGKSFKTEAWFDHQYFNVRDAFTREKYLRRWDWVSVRFSNGSFNMAYTYNGQASLISGKEVKEEREVIFTPKYGRKYSETPFFVFKDGLRIGVGMRERTYGRVNAEVNNAIS